MSARASSSTPREPQQAWPTPRIDGGFGNDGSSLKTAGLNLTGIKMGADPAPSVRSAGRSGELGEHGWMLRRGVQHDVILPTPRTPEGRGSLRERHRQRTGPSEMAKHWSLKQDAIPDPGEGYGVKTYYGENVADNFKAHQTVGVAEYLKTRGEAVYLSSAREPLGKSFVRGHELPAEASHPRFCGFGVRRRSTGPAKEAIHPREVEPESREVRALYNKTHGSHLPGEMALRDYQWPEAVSDDPHFRFGVVDAVDVASRGMGVRAAMNPAASREPNSVPGVNIGSETLEHKRRVTNDHLGRSRNLMTGRQPVPPDHSYGVKTDKNAYDVGDCLRGWYSASEQEPDADLSRCTVPGRRNFQTERRFGIPTIRTDLLQHALHADKRSVTNATSFGDDPKAGHLVAPGKFQHIGVADEDFTQRRGRQELHDILQGAGYSLDERAFEAVFDRALQLHGDGGTTASTEAVMVAYFQVGGPS